MLCGKATLPLSKEPKHDFHGIELNSQAYDFWH